MVVIAGLPLIEAAFRAHASPPAPEGGRRGSERGSPHWWLPFLFESPNFHFAEMQPGIIIASGLKGSYWKPLCNVRSSMPVGRSQRDRPWSSTHMHARTYEAKQTRTVSCAHTKSKRTHMSHIYRCVPQLYIKLNKKTCWCTSCQSGHFTFCKLDYEPDMNMFVLTHIKGCKTWCDSTAGDTSSVSNALKIMVHSCLRGNM